MAGQGSSEYLVMFGTVLLITLLAAVFVGNFMPQGDADESEARSYWAGARPISIKDYSQMGDTMQLMLFNTEPDSRKIDAVQVGDAVASYGFVLAPGSARNFSVSGLRSCKRGVYDSYSYNVVINYSSYDVPVRRQAGTKPIVGKCVE